MSIHRTSPSFRPRQKRSYDVVIVSREPGYWPASAEDWPPAARELSTIMHRVPRRLALATAGGFNAAERLKPYGVWAVVRRITRPRWAA